MPVSPDIGNRFAAPVGDLMAEYELKLLEAAALALRGDQTAEDWATVATSRITAWRIAANRGVAGAKAQLARAVRAALLGAQAEGAAQAFIDLPGVTVGPPPGTRGLDLAVTRLTGQLAAALQGAPALLEAVLREAVRAGVDQVRAGQATRRSASQQVLNRLITQGITGFRDSNGRKWSLTSYAEMAVRTETQARAMEAGLASLTAAGLDLVIVSDSPRECPLCRPFEGKVLSLGEETGPVTRPNELDGPPVTINITATLAQARAAGFQHPNCTHSVSGYIPGVTRQGTAKPNPKGYEEKQKQRAMERQVRKLKRAAAVATDPQAKAAANAKLREQQKILREYVKAHGLKRQPGRESVTRAV